MKDQYIMPMHRRRAQALVEFSLTLPLMLFLLVIGADFGRLFVFWVELNNAAYEGARMASSSTSSDIQVLTQIQTELNGAFSVTSTDVTITPDPKRYTNQIVTVSVGHNFQLITPGFERLLPGGAIRIQATAVTVVQ